MLGEKKGKLGVNKRRVFWVWSEVAVLIIEQKGIVATIIMMTTLRRRGKEFQMNLWHGRSLVIGSLRLWFNTAVTA